ncbi:MAG: enoyl-CoA hydratase/isomerase family protein [Planctomycetes bacterium]|nr:enoyl-CoA hydratase/isomerase family protein [Planctomycetota bacterium]
MSHKDSVQQQTTRELFTTEDHGSYAVLRFGHHVEQQVIDLGQTEKLWQFFESLHNRPTKALLITAPRGTFAPATIDRFWEHVRQTASDRVRSYDSPSVEFEFYREANAFRRFIELVRKIDAFVIISLQGEIDFHFLGLALACDYRIATDDSVFVNRFLDGDVFPGVTPWFLSRFVGHAKATDILLERKTLSTSEAYELGLVNRLTFPNNLTAESLALAERFAAKPTGALIALKKSMVFWSEDLTSYLDHVGTALGRIPPIPQ